MALLFIFMADSPNRPKRANQSSGFSLALMYQIFNNRTVLALLVLRVIASIPSAVSTMFTLFVLFYFIFIEGDVAFPHPLVLFTYLFFFLLDLTHIFHSISPIITKNQFLLDAQKNGFVMSYVGVMMAIAQGFVVGHVSSRYKDHVIMFYATVSFSTPVHPFSLFVFVCILVVQSNYLPAVDCSMFFCFFLYLSHPFLLHIC